MKCPVCGCEYFYVKNPDNPYKYYQFACRDGEVHFSAEVNEDEVPEISDETQTHCIQCVWQGEYGKLIDSREQFTAFILSNLVLSDLSQVFMMADSTC